MLIAHLGVFRSIDRFFDVSTKGVAVWTPFVAASTNCDGRGCGSSRSDHDHRYSCILQIALLNRSSHIENRVASSEVRIIAMAPPSRAPYLRNANG
jgi:hypothetical protein